MKEEVKHDKFGRIIIQDQDLLDQIAGAISVPDSQGDNDACGDNAGCGNAECGNASC